MHTSTVLQSTDFEYSVSRSGQMVGATFEEFCPDYSELDRTAVIAPVVEDGLLSTATALLAQTTAFYDIQRSKSDDFFIYPQHFAILNFGDEGLGARSGRLDVDFTNAEPPWGNLDVWPSCKLIPVDDGVLPHLKAVFDHQMNRLYWPQAFFPRSAPANPLPEYTRRMLASSLKSVYLYGSDTVNVEVRASDAGEEIVEGSGIRLEKLTKGDVERPSLAVNRFQRLAVESFLARVSMCFDA